MTNKKDKIEIFAPATVANISCGFDVLGLCLDNVGDKMIISKTAKKGIAISKIEGYDLPLNPLKNAASVAGMALLKELDLDYGFEIEIYKQIKPGSGIGSSAASSAGAVVGINQLLGLPFNDTALIEFAREGERIACGTPIADNVAPAILGGFTLVKETNPLKVLSLPTPKDLFVVILHPQIEIKTADSRGILPENIPLTDAVKQWANVGSFVSALYTNDYDLLANSIKDVIVEPHRSKLIPFFKETKNIALKNGALGYGISGSGPATFSICKGKDVAEKVQQEIRIFFSKTNIPFKTYSSKINTKGVKTKWI